MEEKIKGIIQKVNMMDKTECDIEAYYKSILEQVTTKEIEVVVEAISDGKYGVQVAYNGKLFWMISKAWDTAREVLVNVVTAINELKLIWGDEEYD